MREGNPALDAAFIEAQRRRLQNMHRQGRETQRGAAEEEQALQREWEEPRDIADRGTNSNRQDVDNSVQHVEARRLAEIERALEKIEDGSYGLSDTSGEPIPRERLEAKPEAIHTVEEEQEPG